MILKFLFDRIVAFIGLAVLWPILLIVAILIKIKMPGPVMFVQQRVGKGGRLFKCHKFRTMTVKHNGSTVSVAGDSRITPLGAKLRHWKLDELPGLWDVLIGNMSFVGPRPDVPGYADKLTGEDRDVLKLRPGITGPATLKYRLEDEMIAEWVAQIRSHTESTDTTECFLNTNQRSTAGGKANGTNHTDRSPKGEKSDENLIKNLPENIDEMSDQELAVWYNDNVIYPDKVRLNCYYYRHYSFVKDIQMIFCTVLGKNMKYNNNT